MSCSDYDWKAYALGELGIEDRRQAEAHAATCSNCREELAGLRLTLDALSTLREEEAPRRIAFVSDKVFEPRWWQSLLRPSFAGACVLALAILVHAFARPALDQTATQKMIETSVARAVADTEQRHEKQLEEVLANYEMIEKQDRLMYYQNTGLVRQ
jgi:anti-sigma factor RsiW